MKQPSGSVLKAVGFLNTLINTLRHTHSDVIDVVFLYVKRFRWVFLKLVRGVLCENVNAVLLWAHISHIRVLLNFRPLDLTFGGKIEHISRGISALFLILNGHFKEGLHFCLQFCFEVFVDVLAVNFYWRVCWQVFVLITSVGSYELKKLSANKKDALALMR